MAPAPSREKVMYFRSLLLLCRSLLVWCSVSCLLLMEPAVAAAAPVGGQGAVVKGRVLDSSGLPLPGATVTLTCGAGAPQVSTADSLGTYAFAAAASRCALSATLEGFAPASREVAVGTADLTIDLVLQVASVKEGVTVVGSGDASAMPGTEPGQGATVSRDVIHNAPLPTGHVDDVLPLIPSVLRGPDGLISMAGARGTENSLLVNGGRETDPVTGEFGVDLPLESVESIEVYPTGYAAEFGQATGGVARVRTRRGEDSFRTSVNSLDPRIRFEGGTTRGVESWTPNVGVSGPLRRGRAWFAQSVDYTWDKNPIYTHAGRQDMRVRALSSLSQIDLRLTNRHDFTATITGTTQTVRGANLNSFMPLWTRPRVGTGGWSLGLNDRLTLGPSSLLESTLQVKRARLGLDPTGSEPYLVGHRVTTGNYFNAQRRTAYRTELSQQYTRTSSSSFGPALLRIGYSLGYSTYSGTNQSRPVALLHSNGTLSRSIAFDGAFHQGASAYDVGLYAAQRWRLASWIMVDLGGRLDAASGQRPVFSPRSEWTAILPWDPQTTIKGGAGLFAGKLVLSARTFDQMQSRTVQSYDLEGASVGPAITYVNQVDGDLAMPKALLWNVEVNRDLGRGWRARVNFQQRDGKDELIVTPRLVTATNGVLTLSSTGDSDAWNLESTVGYVSRTRGHQAYVSYVRSSAQGNLNDLNAIAGNFIEPFVRPDEIGPLRFDVRRRLLAWGLLSVPWQITVAPFLEWRSGFPYSAINDNWTYAEPRNKRRFPQFLSLDLIVNKGIRLPFFHVPARIGFSIYNLTGRRNGRDVQADLDRSDFGHTSNRIRRRLRGQFEIDWGGSTK